MFAFLFSFVNRVDIKVHFSPRRKNKSRAKYINRQRRLQFVIIFFSPEYLLEDIVIARWTKSTSPYTPPPSSGKVI